MPEVIRNRFQNAAPARDGEHQDASRNRPGFGPDEDPLAELARIVGETTQIQHAPQQPAPRRVPVEAREPATAQREYPRRDTSWRDPQARTTVRAGMTAQPMPKQLEDLEAELFSEIRSENLRTLPPAPDLAQLGLPDARMSQYQAGSQPGMPQTRPPAAPGSAAANGRARTGQDFDNEVTLPMHAVLRATPPSPRASEDHAMQQPPRFNPAQAQQPPAPVAAPVSYDHHYDAQEDYDPAGALGGAHYRDYHDAEAPYYVGGELDFGQPPAGAHAYAPVTNEVHAPAPPHYEDHYDPEAHYDDEDGPTPHYEPQRGNRRAAQRGASPVLIGAIAVIGLLVLGTGGVFAYRSMSSGGTTGAYAPLIKADTKPMKEAVTQQPPPAATGPNLTTASNDGQAKLVTQTEDPVDQIPGKPIRVVGTGAGVQTPSLAPVQRVRSVIVRPDGTMVTPEDANAKPPAPPVRMASLPSTDTPPAATSPAPVQPAQVSPPAAVQPPTPSTPAPQAANPALPPMNPVTHIDPVPVAVKPVPVVVAPPKPAVAQLQPPVAKPAKPAPALVPHAPVAAEEPLGLDPSSSPAQPAQPVHVATATPPAPKATQPIEAGTGDYMVQISSARSDAEARHALQAAVQKYASIGAKGGDVQQADLGARGTYYRARLSGGTHEQAAALCSQIKSQGGDCVVSKR